MNPIIKSYIDDHHQEMLDLLKELVCIQSGSRNKKGVDRVGKRILLEMETLGLFCEFQPETDHGNHLIARSRDIRKPDKDPKQVPGQDQILITGHMDTVFPADTSFNYYWENESRCYGPGVADMKGGLVVGIFALKALVRAGLIDKMPICFIFNSDEEIGSPSSRGLIQKEAQKSRLAYVLEAGGLSGEIVTGRKGSLSVRLAVEGKAGHAAFAGRDKASAILELAHKTIAIEAMNQPEKGISANVGLIEGGIGPNTVAQHARASLDFRYLEPGDDEQVKAGLEKIVSLQTIAGTRTSMEIAGGRPPMPQTPGNTRLYDQIQALAKTLGIAVTPELRPGVSDANFIAQQGIPVIDGLGPLGAMDHSEDEYIDKQSLFDRTLLFAHILAGI